MGAKRPKSLSYICEYNDTIMQNFADLSVIEDIFVVGLIESWHVVTPWIKKLLGLIGSAVSSHLGENKKKQTNKVIFRDDNDEQFYMKLYSILEPEDKKLNIWSLHGHYIIK